MRLYFRALEDVDATTTSDLVWFATVEDCPDWALESDTVKVTYYDPASPDGVLPALGGANVMTPPAVLEEGGLDVGATQFSLAAADYEDLPAGTTLNLMRQKHCNLTK